MTGEQGVPLTSSNARPGLRVRCVDAAAGAAELCVGQIYAVEASSRHFVFLNKLGGAWKMSRFVLADLPTVAEFLAEHAPDLLEAWRDWRADRTSSARFFPATRNLMETGERHNLHRAPVRPAPGVTDTKPTLEWEWIV